VVVRDAGRLPLIVGNPSSRLEAGEKGGTIFFGHSAWIRTSVTLIFFLWGREY
jgi:hypothetical protein